ncbi:hypothetical protein T484DRAFT_1985818, partial [Baffinella frigidus]
AARCAFCRRRSSPPRRSGVKAAAWMHCQPLVRWCLYLHSHRRPQPTSLLRSWE